MRASAVPLPLRAAASLAAVVAFVAPLAGASLAEAQEADRPIVLTVEAGGDDVDLAAVRQAVESHLEVPVVSLLDDRASGSAGVLVVAVGAGGQQAALCFYDSTGGVRFHRVEGEGAELTWVGEAVARFLRDLVEDRSWMLPSEVLDPFTPPTDHRQRNIATEVIDPWDAPWVERRGVGEQGSQLDSPAPR